MLKYIQSLTVLPLACTALSGQNLVGNSSFELGAVCTPTEKVTNVQDWQPVAGSPQFINVKCALDANSRTYIRGMQLPSAYSGDIYAGIGIDTEGEFLQTPLTQTLNKDDWYWVRMWVRMPVRMCFAPLSEIGVHLGEAPLAPTKDYRSLDLPNIALRPADYAAINKQYEWQEISALYQAKGNEKQLVVGNFANNNKTVFQTRKRGECSYVYLDSVVVEPFRPIELTHFSPTWTPKINERVHLNKVTFEQNMLTEESKNQLEELVVWLNTYTGYNIELSGHTDNEGSDSDQQQRSKKMAQEVYTHLLKRGIPAKRITVAAKGSRQNIVLNDTPAHRQANQRIEIKIQ